MLVALLLWLVSSSVNGSQPRHLALAELCGPAAPATLSIEEAAEVLGVSRGVAYESARTGALPVLRLGHRLRVPVPRLVKMLGAGGD